MLLAVYCVCLLFIFDRPIFLSINFQFSVLGLLLEIIGVALAAYFISKFYKSYGLYNTLSFFIPLFLIGAVTEGDWIVKGRYTFHKLNFYFWDTPIVIVLYWSGAYLLYLLYQRLGKGWLNRVKGVTIHLLVDLLITTPLAVLFGFWTFRSTLLDSYPYIVPVLHLWEVSLVLFYIIFQERLIGTVKIREKFKPVVSLTVIFLFLLIYATTNHYFDRFI